MVSSTLVSKGAPASEALLIAASASLESLSESSSSEELSRNCRASWPYSERSWLAQASYCLSRRVSFCQRVSVTVVLLPVRSVTSTFSHLSERRISSSSLWRSM